VIYRYVILRSAAQAARAVQIKDCIYVRASQPAIYAILPGSCIYRACLAALSTNIKPFVKLVVITVLIASVTVFHFEPPLPLRGFDSGASMSSAMRNSASV